MSTIKLYRRNEGWFAKFSDPAVSAAFGTDTIPTAFTSHAPAQLVFEKISALNPNAIVEIAA